VGVFVYVKEKNMPVSSLIQISMESWGVVFCLMLVVFILSNNTKQERPEIKLLKCVVGIMFMLITDVLAAVSNNAKTNIGYWLLVISNFAYFLSIDFTVIFVVDFFLELIPKKDSSKFMIKEICYGVIAVAVALLIGNLWGGYFYVIDGNVYDRGSLHFVQTIMHSLPFAVVGLYIIVNFKKIDMVYQRLFMTYVVTVLVCAVVQEISFGISLINFVCMFLVILTYTVLLSENNRRKFIRINEIIEEKKKQEPVQPGRNAACIVNPHFMKTSLECVYKLCDDNPKRAQKQVGAISNYMQGHLIAYNHPEPVSVDKEMEQVEYYLTIEQIRLGARLTVDYDIKESDFLLPMLSVQSLVENAVKHGIQSKKNGGTVRISTYSTNEAYYVKVADDGIGFNTLILNSGSYSQKGINTVREKLKSIDGTLTIKSEAGKGTEAIIEIKKK